MIIAHGAMPTLEIIFTFVQIRVIEFVKPVGVSGKRSIRKQISIEKPERFGVGSLTSWIAREPMVKGQKSN